jgi:hypothetical protein
MMTRAFICFSPPPGNAAPTSRALGARMGRPEPGARRGKERAARYPNATTKTAPRRLGARRAPTTCRDQRGLRAAPNNGRYVAAAHVGGACRRRAYQVAFLGALGD